MIHSEDLNDLNLRFEFQNISCFSVRFSIKANGIKWDRKNTYMLYLLPNNMHTSVSDFLILISSYLLFNTFQFHFIPRCKNELWSMLIHDSMNCDHDSFSYPWKKGLKMLGRKGNSMREENENNKISKYRVSTKEGTETKWL